jgi:spermidine synthase
MGDEWAPQIEYRLPRARYRDAFNLDVLLSKLLEQRPGLSQAALALNVPVNAMPEFERSYVASFLAARSWVAALRGDKTGEAQRLMRLAFEANPRDRWIGFDLADKMLATLPQALDRGMNKRQALQAILQVRPDHAEALRALWRVEKDAGDGKAAAFYRARLKAVSPLDRDIYDIGAGQAQKKTELLLPVPH